MDDSAAPLSAGQVRALLTEVLTHGAPAQQVHAQALIARLNDHRADDQAPDDQLVSEAMLLVDGFRNDPYLWR